MVKIKKCGSVNFVIGWEHQKQNTFDTGKTSEKGIEFISDASEIELK